MCRSSKQEIGCNWWDAFALRMCRKLQYRQESETRPHWEPQPLFAQFTFILFRIEFKPGFGRRLHLPILSTYLPNPRGSKRASATSPPVNTDQTFHPLNSALLTLAERREQGASASASAAKKFWHEGGEGGAQLNLHSGRYAGCRWAVQLNAKPSSEWQGRSKNTALPFSLLNSPAGTQAGGGGMHFEILTTISCNCS